MKIGDTYEDKEGNLLDLIEIDGERVSLKKDEEYIFTVPINVLEEWLKEETLRYLC